MNRTCLFFIAIGILHINGHAQQQTYCGVDSYYQNKFITDKAYKDAYNSNSTELNYQGKNTSSVTIPVVFHLVVNNQNEILPQQAYVDAIRILNENFRRQNPDAQYTGIYGGGLNQFGQFIPISYSGVDVGVNFVLSAVTIDVVPSLPTINLSNYEQLKYEYNYPEYSSSCHLKVWVCKSEFEGWATFPWDLQLNPTLDGVVLNYYDIGVYQPHLQDVLTHEVGHWLGLRHITGDVNCGDDYVTDTYPQPALSQNLNQSCQYQLVYCPNFNYGYLYAHMFDNYMDYSSSYCMNFFSAGQKSRMQYCLDTYRYSLYNNDCYTGLDETDSNSKPYYYMFNDQYYLQPNNYIINSIDLYSLEGRLLKNVVTNNSINNGIPIQIDELPPSIYLLVCKTVNGNYVLKINKY